MKQLAEIDQQYMAEQRSGPLLLEIHYRRGCPFVAKVREAILAPIRIEMGLTVSMASTS